MSLKQVQADTDHFKAVGHIDEYDAKRMTAPSSDMGVVMDYAEHSAVKDLYQDVVNGRLSASNEAKQILSDAVAKGPNLIINTFEWTGLGFGAFGTVLGVLSSIGILVTLPVALVTVSVGTVLGFGVGFFMD